MRFFSCGSDSVRASHMTIRLSGYLVQKRHFFSQSTTLLHKSLYVVACVMLANYLENKRNCADRLSWHDVFI